MSFGDAPAEDLYTNQTSSSFRGSHMLVAIGARFYPKRQPVPDTQAKEIGVDHLYYKDLSDGVLLTTRGGDRYDRTFLESFLRPGIGHGNWVSRANYPALNVVQTAPAEMSVYVARDYAQPTTHLLRYSMRLDGFASVLSGGEVITKPFRFSGSRLELNYSTSGGGGIRVEVQDEAGRPLAGFGAEDCVEIIGDEIARDVRWNEGEDVSRLAGRTVRLRLFLRDADLYSLRFRPAMR